MRARKDRGTCWRGIIFRETGTLRCDVAQIAPRETSVALPSLLGGLHRVCVCAETKNSVKPATPSPRSLGPTFFSTIRSHLSLLVAGDAFLSESTRFDFVPDATSGEVEHTDYTFGTIFTSEVRLKTVGGPWRCGDSVWHVPTNIHNLTFFGARTVVTK